ncbi:hypothetical protein ES703_35715 [subsurface metagenome]
MPDKQDPEEQLSVPDKAAETSAPELTEQSKPELQSARASESPRTPETLKPSITSPSEVNRSEQSHQGRGAPVDRYRMAAREERPQGRGRYKPFFKRKVCKFCTKKLTIDYKNPEALKRFTTERGKILPRRITGTCARHQRKLAKAIKRARVLALLPFVAK